MKKIDAWRDLFRRIGRPTQADRLFTRLKRAYKTPTRHYHTIDHALECVSEFEAFRGATDHAVEVELALWYHDAVYEPGAEDNELRSAGFAAGEIEELGLDDGARRMVRRLILVTDHFGETARTLEERIVRDVDLAVLGRPAEGFDEYEAAIRREYAFVGEEDYRRGRIAVVRELLDRPHIYETDIMQEQYEEAARLNLRRSLERLAGNG